MNHPDICNFDRQYSVTGHIFLSLKVLLFMMGFGTVTFCVLLLIMKSGGGGEEEEMVTLESLSKKMDDFAKARDWEKFHSPRNLLLAMVGEVGELSEIFQWKGEVTKGVPEFKEEEKEHLGEELSDVLLYLVRLSDMCGVDLGKAALRKLQLNAIKYPIKQTYHSVGNGEDSSSNIMSKEEN